MSNVDPKALEVVTQRLKDADASSTVSLSTARQLCSELNYAVALLTAADKVCTWARHDNGCHGPCATGSCTCGLQEARGAYEALKGKQDDKTQG
ncbi:hypothetical protein LCGC14_1435630 [marine sediment metagenome]|uniref:Uncharacterized protein n=1 Tax=marine sediment metagenome TaxID=412755 RepID=A0A0F9JMT5_9ZZZZ